MALAWQPTLLDAGSPTVDTSFASARRRFLGDGAWVDAVPGWVSGAAGLFDQLAASAPWRESERPMYDRIVAVPRLHTGAWADPPAIVRTMAEAISARYGLDLGAVSANLYRDGADSVAWHGDRIGRRLSSTVVAILTLGATRRFLLRRAGGGPSVRYQPTSGDLLVLGGTCQRTWQHCVPKQAGAGPRICVMFREAYE
jgi:alkylated DNA repair dioxygenase AlkB